MFWVCGRHTNTFPGTHEEEVGVRVCEKVLDIATTILAHMAANVEIRIEPEEMVKEALLYAETLWKIWEQGND